MKKIKIEIKNRWTGKSIFEYELENNTIKETVLKAIELNANLRYADLRSADLRSANLRYADLSGADLRSANLRYADIKEFEHLFAIIPMEGSFIAWKKLKDNCVAKIEIPSKAPRTYSLIGRKCRAKYVKTLQIFDSEDKEIKEACSQRSLSTKFKVGRLTHADKWDNNKRVECTHGIHFFVTRKEAEDW
jgi:hypothetical protein